MLSVALLASSGYLSTPRNGTNVIITQVGSSRVASYEHSADLPSLPHGIRTLSYGISTAPDADGKYSGYDGVIKIGGVWSLTPGSSFCARSESDSNPLPRPSHFIIFGARSQRTSHRSSAHAFYSPARAPCKPQTATRSRCAAASRCLWTMSTQSVWA